MRQLHYLLRIADNERYKELEFSAKLHDKKIPKNIEPLAVTEDDREGFDKAARKAEARLRMRYAKRQSTLNKD